MKSIPPPITTLTRHATWIGYGTPEKFLCHAPKDVPVYVSSYIDSAGTDHAGATYESVRLIVALLAHQGGEVHYTLCTLGRYLCVNRQPIDADGAKAARDRAEQAVHIAGKWINELGFEDVRDATIGTPRDVKLLDGWPSFLVWDQEKKAFQEDVHPNLMALRACGK
jgi:hypothetical protein